MNNKYIKIQKEHIRQIINDISTVLDSTEVYRYETYDRLNRVLDYLEARLKSNE